MVSAQIDPGPVGGYLDAAEYESGGANKKVRDVSDLATLASAVRSARKRKGWNQQQLADEAQVSLGVVNNLERQKTRPQPGNLDAILSALGIEPADAKPPAESEDARNWPRDIAVVLDVMGLYLQSIPEERRAEQIHAITRYVFNLAREQGPY